MNNRIKELRAKEDLSQLELARLAGVRRETIVFLEKGKYNPSLRLAHEIARHFRLPIEEVFLFIDKADKKQTGETAGTEGKTD
jgi:putative transcriptional regulator